jgi:XTP/dITP diphosphohydrolase
MIRLLLATTNPNKIREIGNIFTGLSIELVAPDQCHLPAAFEVEETGTTFAENARLKAQGYGHQTGLLTLAEDSGLIVDALDGRPGVYSKRYGDNDAVRNHKILDELKNVPESQRTARFICSAYLYSPDTKQFQTAEGIVEGIIAPEARGLSGFGYDPVFIPTEIHQNTLTFAQLGPEVKNRISHRARAMEGIKQYLVELT